MEKIRSLYNSIEDNFDFYFVSVFQININDIRINTSNQR